MNNIYLRGTVAVAVGILLNFVGDVLLGVKIEIFSGMATFTFPWIVDVFMVPFVAGFVVAKIYRKRGGKWLACLPPLFVRAWSSLSLYLWDPLWHADFSFHHHLHYWGLAVILAVEAANLGGVLGEFVAGAYGGRRRPKGAKAVSIESV